MDVGRIRKLHVFVSSTMSEHKNLGCSLLLAGLAAAAPAHADSAVTDWNEITVNCAQVAPTPPDPMNPANRAGPPGLLDIALVQTAVHDAIQGIERKFESYQFEDPSVFGTGSPEAAAAGAAYYALVGLYGADDPCLATAPDPTITYASDAGVDVGKAAAAALLPHYRSTLPLPVDPFIGGTGPGEWRPTPGILQGANTALANMPPWTMESSRQFRPGPPPRLDSRRYTREYEEVKELGSVDSLERTAEQTELARFWSVNFITQWFATVRAIADENVSDLGDQARILALVSLAAADSQISIYDTKYAYNLWRPITAIHNGDDDGNSNTEGDPEWEPFLPTPPYSDYTSGANCLTASITTILQLYFGTDRFDFEVSSTAMGLENPTRTYERFSQAQWEVVEARILQGIHFRTADEEGRRQGVRIAVHAFNNFLRPVSPLLDPGMSPP